MMYGLGARPDPPERRTQKDALEHPLIGGRFHNARRIGGAPFPPEYSLEHHEPERFHQGRGRGCTAHDASAAIVTACAAAGHPLDFVPSPRGIYAATRGIERDMATPKDAELPALDDAGAYPADVMEAIKIYGVSPMRTSSPDGRNSDLWTDEDVQGIHDARGNVNDEPALEEFEQSGLSLITGEYRIDEKAPDVVDQACVSIAAGFPVYVCFFADSAFERWTPGSSPATPPDRSDPLGGGHAVFLDGYRTLATGHRAFRLVNSWGLDWGDRGTCLVSESWLRAAFDLYVMSVASGS